MAGDDPTGDRSIIRFEPNERVDLPDMKALQDNGRSESRLLVHNFLFGHGGMGTPNAIDVTASGWVGVRSTPTSALIATGLTDAETNHSQGGLCNWVAVTTVADQVTVNVKYFPELFPLDDGGPQTGGFAGVALDDATIEQGFAAGCEGDDSQTLSLTGSPAGTYGVYFGGVADAGSPQTRLFWNANTEVEDAQAMDTRKIVGWNTRLQLLSAGPPNAAYQCIHVIEWDGATITAQTPWQNNLFEGLVGATAPFVNATGWGEDGSVGTSLYGFRSYDRAVNGVACWQDWAALIRAQLRDIIGDAEGTTLYGHWTALPEFTGAGGSAAWVGERSSLTHSRDHIETDTDPHGPVLTQTDLQVTNDLTVEALGGGEANAVLVDAATVNISAAYDAGLSQPGVQMNAPLYMASNHDLYLSGNSHIKGYNPYLGETIDDGRDVFSTFGATSFLPAGETLVVAGKFTYYQLEDLYEEYVNPGTSKGGSAWYFEDSNQTNQDRLHLPLNSKIPISSGTLAGGLRLFKIFFYFYSNPNWLTGPFGSAATVAIKKRQHGVADCQEWTTMQIINVSQGDAGTDGTQVMDVPPGPGAIPTLVTMDLSAEPAADYTIGGGFFGEEWELQVRLRGDGGACFSPYFAGCIVQFKLGSIV